MKKIICVALLSVLAVAGCSIVGSEGEADRDAL